MKGSIIIIVVTIIVASSMVMYPEFFQSRFLKEPSNVRPLAENITRHCLLNEYGYESYNWCVLNSVNDFIKENISYINNNTDYPTADQVLDRGYGKCIGKAVVFRSLMESLGYETQYIMQEEHVCASVYINGYNRLWNCGKEDLLFIG